MPHPTFPENFSELTDAQIRELLGQARDWAASVAADDRSAETTQALADIAAGAERARTELSTRETADAERSAALAALAVVPDAPAPPAPVVAEPVAAVAEPAADAPPVAEPEPESAMAVAASATVPATPMRVPDRHRVEPVRAEAVLLASADVPGLPTGTPIESAEMLTEAITRVKHGWGEHPGRAPAPSVEGERTLIASLRTDYPEERQLHKEQSPDWLKVMAVASPSAIVAAGGLCAPVQPYYGIQVLPVADRPVRDALVTFNAARGGIRFIPPPQWLTTGDGSRQVTDGATTNTSTTVTSATAAFTTADIGGTISGAGIPTSTVISSVQSATSITLSAAATATATGVTLTIGTPGTVKIISASQDASALGAVGGSAAALAATKPCKHVTCPNVTEVDVQAISRCVEFGNFAARAYPEQVPAWLAYANAMWARRAEQALLDGIATASVAGTQAKTYGTAVQTVTSIQKAANWYRNLHRMAPGTPLRVLAPRWLLGACRSDLINGSGYDMDKFRASLADVESAIDEAGVNVSWYMDSGTSKSQLMGGGTYPTSGAIATYPSNAVWYIFAEGSFLFLDGGTLDFGLIRDSSLNAANNFRIFMESFENVAFIGDLSVEVTSTVVADGTYAPSATAVSSF